MIGFDRFDTVRAEPVESKTLKETTGGGDESTAAASFASCWEASSSPLLLDDSRSLFCLKHSALNRASLPILGEETLAPCEDSLDE